MDVQLQLDLNEEEERGFKDLILLCNQEDKTNYDTALDYDFFYSIRNEEKKESGLKEDYLAILMGYKLGEQEEGKDILLCTVFI
ncbi:MAG: GNAT family N-acetyltransferase, partial [Oribacterium parvum]|nr:GNAT family N-acetyltransferase [Oribacterium parvum]